MIKEFYAGFHKQIVSTTENSGKFSGEKLLGVDPATGKNVYVKVGRFGPVAQIGDTESEEKPRFAGLRKDQSIEDVTLEDVLKLFEFPRILGRFEDKEVSVSVGRFGPYVKHNNTFYSLAKTDNPATIDMERAIEIIEEKRKKDVENTILTFANDPEMKVLNGRFGPYVSYKKKNYRIGKDVDPKTLTYEDCMELVETDPKATTKKAAPKRKTTKKK